MNESSKHIVPIKVNDWLQNATQKLQAIEIPSARLDAELLLAHVLGKSRTWLIAHSDELLPERVIGKTNGLIELRLKRTPLAYLVGHKEFYRRNFIVTPDVLIPRPETEVLIDIALSLPLLESPTIHDAGTGSGCIAITIKREMPSAQVSASDISKEAVLVAQKNADEHRADVTIRQSNLMDTWYSTGGVDLIIANLPYVDRAWERSPETDYEPDLALFAENNGLELIYKLVDQAPSRLIDGGYLLLEADPEQHAAISDYAAKHGFDMIESRDYALLLQKS